MFSNSYDLLNCNHVFSTYFAWDEMKYLKSYYQATIVTRTPVKRLHITLKKVALTE